MSRMQDEIELSSAAVYVGIDVGKTVLDYCVHPSCAAGQVENAPAGIRKMARRFKRAGVRLIALEATGRYHRLAHRMLHEAGLKVAVVNPYRSRRFADALGRLAKSDKIDAEVLARFAAIMTPEASPPKEVHKKALCDLNVGRRQVLCQIGDLKRQLYETDHPVVSRQIKARIRMAERHLQVLEQEIRELIQAHPALKRRFEILNSIPGVGFVAAITMLTDLEELGEANCREIAALTGVAPMNRESGSLRGARVIRGGRPHVRNVLYMCAITQIRREGSASRFYKRLVSEQGKKPKVALTAVMRKLVVLANTLIAEDRFWRPAQSA